MKKKLASTSTAKSPHYDYDLTLNDLKVHLNILKTHPVIAIRREGLRFHLHMTPQLLLLLSRRQVTCTALVTVLKESVSG